VIFQVLEDQNLVDFFERYTTKSSKKVRLFQDPLRLRLLLYTCFTPAFEGSIESLVVTQANGLLAEP
jgi:hypothetical protein